MHAAMTGVQALSRKDKLLLITLLWVMSALVTRFPHLRIRNRDRTLVNEYVALAPQPPQVNDMQARVWDNGHTHHPPSRSIGPLYQVVHILSK